MSLRLDLMGAEIRHIETPGYGNIRTIAVGDPADRPSGVRASHRQSRRGLFQQPDSGPADACGLLTKAQLYMMKQNSSRSPLYEQPNELNGVAWRFFKTGKAS